MSSLLLFKDIWKHDVVVVPTDEFVQDRTRDARLDATYPFPDYAQMLKEMYEWRETLTNKTADHRSHRFYRLTCLCLFRPAGLYGRCAGRNKKTLDSIQDVISAECHLEDREQVNDLIQTNRPDYILHLAGKIQLRSRGSILLHIWRVMLWAPSICLRLFGGIVRTVAW